MTDMERRAIQDIHPWKVTYLPGSWDKRFAHDLNERAARDDWREQTLSRAQRKCLWEKIVRYRKQLKEPGLLHYAKQQLVLIEQEELAEAEAQQVKVKHRDTESTEAAPAE